MHRRKFLFSLAGGALAQAAPPQPVRITQLAFAPLEGRFHKFVAMNSQDKTPKGHTYSGTLVRIATDQGIEGLGTMGYAPPDADFLRAASALVGANPLALYRFESGRIVARAPSHQALLNQYKHLDGPLFDLIGKLHGVPCWRLIGDAARQRIEVYDGTLYFSDVWFRDRGPRAVVEEAEEALKSGYLGMKLKLGRGWKWMDKDAGLARDIEVVRAVRKAAGPKTKVLVDANNGFRDDFERAWRLMAETRDANLYWMEEIFPENVEHYSRLRERMEQARIKTLIADGENVGDPKEFEPYLKPRRLLDVLQMDIRRGGFLGNLEMARMGRAAGAISVPHNWGSQIGLYMGLHLAKAVESVAAAEDDRSTCDVIVADGYRFQGGYYTVPDTPGLSIRVNEEVYKEKCRPREVVVS